MELMAKEKPSILTKSGKVTFDAQYDLRYSAQTRIRIDVD